MLVSGNADQMQFCDAKRCSFRISVPSKSKPDERYFVEGEFNDGFVRCECRGFKFRGTCSHTEFHEERCGWNEVESKEKQTAFQRRNGICPRCGSKTARTFRKATEGQQAV